ncbi:TPA: fimbrial protein [Klebsiella oxytoca]
MKKSLYFIGFSALLSSSLFAADGKINFTGTVIDSACTVTNSESSPLSVNLGKVAKNAFSGAGSTAAPTKFTIQLKDCPDTVSSATVKFDGTPFDGDNSVLALTSEDGVATGVGVQISDSSQKVLPLSQASSQYALTTTTDNINNLEFVARYVATSATITAGPANANASFTINYN